MRSIHFVVTALLGLTALAAVTASATPVPTSAIFHLRVWNDCPTSTLTSGSTYPTNVYIHDLPDCASGYANLHTWRLSTDDVNAAVFNNTDAFSISAVCSLTGSSNGETGLQVSPWWAQDSDGRFNIRVPDGEIACFGGRLPFYSFTASHGLHYTAGSVITLSMTYQPHSLSQADPATMEYQCDYDNQHYTSGPLPFDEGNGAEGYGTWGILDDARVGGHFQPLVAVGADLSADWSNIDFQVLAQPTGACCFADDTCQILNQASCGAQAGSYQGDGTVCDPNPCGQSPVQERTWGAIKHSFR